MHVHSFFALLGVSLATFVVADDDQATYHKGAIFTADAPVEKRAALPMTRARRSLNKRDATICEDLPARWSYSGW